MFYFWKCSIFINFFALLFCQKSKVKFPEFNRNIYHEIKYLFKIIDFVLKCVQGKPSQRPNIIDAIQYFFMEIYANISDQLFEKNVFQQMNKYPKDFIYKFGIYC